MGRTASRSSAFRMYSRAMAAAVATGTLSPAHSAPVCRDVWGGVPCALEDAAAACTFQFSDVWQRSLRMRVRCALLHPAIFRMAVAFV